MIAQQNCPDAPLTRSETDPKALIRIFKFVIFELYGFYYIQLQNCLVSVYLPLENRAGISGLKSAVGKKKATERKKKQKKQYYNNHRQVVTQVRYTAHGRARYRRTGLADTAGQGLCENFWFVKNSNGKQTQIPIYIRVQTKKKMLPSENVR